MATPAHVACGERHTLVVDTAGNVWAAGGNRRGQLGLGHRRNTDTFTQVPDIQTDHVDCGASHSAIIGADRRAHLVGENNDHQLGRAEIPGVRSNKFLEVADIEAVQVACGDQHTALIDASGVLWTAGSQSYGQLGRGRTKSVYFAPAGAGTFIADQVACGKNHTVVVDIDGNVWAAGANSQGQTGLDTATPGPGFHRIDGIQAAQVACGDHHTVLLGTDGTVWVCGSNSAFQLGHPTTPGRRPTRVPGIVGAQVACGHEHSVIVDVDGNVWAAGDNTFGQLGLGETTDVAEFAQVPDVVASQVACGSLHTVVIAGDQLLVAGDNADGQHGCGTEASREFAPVELGTRRAEVASALRGRDVSISDAYELADAALI